MILVELYQNMPMPWPTTIEEVIYVWQNWRGKPTLCPIRSIFLIWDKDEIPKANWGSGLFKVEDDGSLKLVASDWDSSG